MSRKQTIELEWFTLQEKLPEENTPIITDYSDRVLTKTDDNCYENHFGNDFYITDNEFTEWAYYPF
jgi:hypothetical protein